jgi:hypothetical protein
LLIAGDGGRGQRALEPKQAGAHGEREKDEYG